MSTQTPEGGPLAGLRVIEVAGIGPGPFAAMMLADMGAEVLRIDRASAVPPMQPVDPSWDLLGRSRRSVAVDLKNPEGGECVLRLCESADVLIEGFRPGVAERLGFGPTEALARNSTLVYGRMTGFGQTGPLASAAGHDINYVAISGALYHMGPADAPPVPPLNLVGDFGGGGMLLAVGILAALHERSTSGKGQVVDAAMVDGSALLTTVQHSIAAMGMWNVERGTNIVDGGAPFYGTYETSDGKYLAVGPIEDRFRLEFATILGLDVAELGDPSDPTEWPKGHDRVAEVIRQRTAEDWLSRTDGTDACVTPILSIFDAPDHPHNQARQVFCEVDGIAQPSPAPRFDRTPSPNPTGAPNPGEHTDEGLAAWGFSDAEIGKLRDAGVVAQIPNG
ncbi:MAG: CoA transferase [Ilumatobacteraceae bacterium]|nr:CoA transferase [Ilumatobacteraceae bacterium]